mmetsp:Transcript_47680/g.93123  ORF Transcript_47680/g.93123 Transcript_47680/m.93123 type:complete len:266 (-) Transcript_47680:151-948(-)
MVWRRQPPEVHEVVRLDPGEGGRKFRVVPLLDVFNVGLRERRRHLPRGPELGSGLAHLHVVGGESLVVRLDQRPALGLRNVLRVRLVGVRKDERGPLLEKKVELLPLHQEDAAHHELGDALRVLDGVHERQGRSPGAPEAHPLVDAEGLPQRLEVLHEVPGGVVGEVGGRRRPPCSSLVDQDDAVALRIEEAAVTLRAPPAGPTVDEHHRLAVPVAALLVVDRVARAHVQPAGVVGFDRGVQRAERGAASEPPHGSGTHKRALSD